MSPLPVATRHLRWLMVIFLAGLAARIAAAAVLGSSFYFADETIYLETARRLLLGAGFGDQYRRVPGYPVFLALLAAPLPSALVFLRIAQSAVAASGCVLIFWLARRMFGPGPGLAASLVYALDPLLVVTGGLLYPEAIAAILIIPTTLLVWEAADRDRLSASVAAGILLGVLALLRPVALTLIPVVVIWTAATVQARISRRALHGALVAVACLATLGPWLYRNSRVHGGLSPISPAGTHTAPVDAKEVQRRGLAAAFLQRARDEPLALGAHIAREFGHFWELAPSRIKTDDPSSRAALHRRDARLPAQSTFPRGMRDWGFAISFGVEASLALLGLIIAFRSHRRQATLLLCTVLAFALGYALFVGKLRYRISILPLIFLLTAFGAHAIYAGLSRSPRRPQGASV